MVGLGTTNQRREAIDLDRAKHVEGMPIAEGRKLLQELQDHAETRAAGCQHHWRDHDVLVGDDASVQHKAGGNFRLGEPRHFWRCMIAGDPLEQSELIQLLDLMRGGPRA